MFEALCVLPFIQLLLILTFFNVPCELLSEQIFTHLGLLFEELLLLNRKHTLGL